MLYVSDIDTTGRAVVRIKDYENSEYELSFFETELMSGLKECGIIPQTVVWAVQVRQPTVHYSCSRRGVAGCWFVRRAVLPHR